MRIHLSAAIIAVLSLLCAQTAAWGQGRTLFGNSSALGGTMTGGVQRSFAGGTGGAGEVGQSAQNIGGVAGEMANALRGMTQQFISSSATNAGQAGQFVGADAGDMQSFVGDVQAGQRRQTSVQGVSSRSSGRSNRSGGFGRGASRGRRTATQFRSTIRVGFSRSVVAPSRVSTALAQRLSRSRRVQTVSPVEVVIQGRTATLRGVVATGYDRALAEQLARLEPGIGQVRNELVVAVTPAEPELPAPGEAPAQPLAAPMAAPPSEPD